MQSFLAFMFALAITASLIPLLARWAPAMGLTDKPGPRKVHAQPVPRVGGIAMACGIVVPTMVAVASAPQLSGLLMGVGVLLIFGVMDDRVELGYGTKFLGQIIAVLLVMNVGDVRVDAITLSSRFPLPEPLASILTFVFLVGVTNAVNLADGLDGLAGGMALICCCGIALLAAAGDNSLAVNIALITAGAILGFLRFNTHPARVFMGDCGSQILGFAMGVLALLVTQGEAVAVSAALPLLLIGMPILDTLTVMTQRIRQGRSPFSADANHLHHRLLGLGFGHGEAVALVYVAQSTMFVAAYFLRFESDVVIVAAFVAFGAVILGSIQYLRRIGWNAHQPGRASALTRLSTRVRRLLGPSRLPVAALWTMGVSLLAFAGIAIAASEQIGADIAGLSIGMLAFVVLVSVLPGVQTWRWCDRAAGYVTVVLVVFLDQTSVGDQATAHDLSWVLLGIAGLAALLRSWLSASRNFEPTPLDLLVVFVALVIPNLPGPLQLSAVATGGIAKAVLILYVLETLLATEYRRLYLRGIVILILGSILLRSLLT